jgi:hypothetical protein
MNIDLKSDLKLALIAEVNCLEAEITEKVETVIEPWKVKSLSLNLEIQTQEKAIAF